MVRSFATADCLALWEAGAGLHPIDRVLLVLRYACPEYGDERLATLSLGQRDALLLKVRQQIFGDHLDAYTECPACREGLEFSLSCGSLMTETSQEEITVRTVTIEGVEYQLRCPDSRDAAAAADSENVEAAKRALLERCIARPNVSEPREDRLPASVQAAVAAELAAIDPQAELLIDLSCPACGCEWQGIFEIATFFWAEIRARARRLLQEVDAIARTYGWSEADILRMTDARRQLYVQMAVS